MGKNAKRRREAKEAARAARGPAGNGRGWSRAEETSVWMIAQGQDPANPPCPGPIAIHVDGAFECHGGCEGVMTAFHEPDALATCDDDRVPEVAHVCRRCVDQKPVVDNPAPASAVKAGVMPGIAACAGMEIDHEDGSVTCSLGDDCADPGAFHASGISCSLTGDHCDICA
jgi:hypothetical protein